MGFVFAAIVIYIAYSFYDAKKDPLYTTLATNVALEDSGLPADESVIYYDTIVRETGFEAGLKALEAGCDALYSAGDFSALGAIEAARSKGLRIPEDFGIVGTADESFTALMSPSMSSLALNPFEMGRQAAQAFLSGEEGTVVVPMELKMRESSTRNKQQIQS